MLTERQKEVLEFIEKHLNLKGYFPSLSEIAETLGINNRSGVVGHIKALEKKGYIKKQGPKASLYSLKEEDDGFPLVATIPAGVPNHSFEQPIELLHFNPDYFGRGEIQAVKVSGESMIGDAIEDGDIALIRIQKDTAPHDIVAVRVDREEITLKRIRKKNHIVELIASNPNFPKRSVDASEVEVIGKLVGIIRKF
jgi:repressor LexA